jgi:hypothetical protein
MRRRVLAFDPCVALALLRAEMQREFAQEREALQATIDELRAEVSTARSLLCEVRRARVIEEFSRGAVVPPAYRELH